MNAFLAKFGRQKTASTVDPETARYRYGGVGRWMHPPAVVGTSKSKDGGVQPVPNTNILGSYNSVMNQIPIINLMWAFLGSKTSGTTWPQLSVLLENVSIVCALILALVITFHSAFSFDELNSNDARFAINGAQYRTVNNFVISDSYARWWYGGNAGQNGGGRMSNCDNTQLFPNPDCKGQSHQVSEEFNATCLISEAFLTLSLLLSVFILATGGITPIGRPSAASDSHQYTVVIDAYMKYIRFVVFVALLAAVIGLFMFFQLIKFEVFLKFSDVYVEHHANSMSFPANPFSSFAATIYGFSHSSIVYYTFLPLFIFAWILAAGQRAIFSFPIQPFTDFLEPENERSHSRAALVDFLVKTCKLSHCGPTVNMTNEDSEYKEYIFLANAGGARSNDAEVIADNLYDAGIRTVQELILFVKTGDDEIFNITGISMAAASQIIWSVSADLDEVWYNQPELLYTFKSDTGEREVYDNLKQMDRRDPDFTSKTTKSEGPINQISVSERATRKKAIEIQMGGKSIKSVPVNEGVKKGTPLAWNGYLCEFVPAAENMVVQPHLDSNIRIEPFSNFQWTVYNSKKNRAGKTAKNENAQWHAKLQQAWADWGLYIKDKVDEPPQQQRSRTFSA